MTIYTWPFLIVSLVEGRKGGRKGRGERERERETGERERKRERERGERGERVLNLDSRKRKLANARDAATALTINGLMERLALNRGTRES